MHFVSTKKIVIKLYLVTQVLKLNFKYQLIPLSCRSVLHVRREIHCKVYLKLIKIRFKLPDFLLYYVSRLQQCESENAVTCTKAEFVAKCTFSMLERQRKFYFMIINIRFKLPDFPLMSFAFRFLAFSSVRVRTLLLGW